MIKGITGYGYFDELEIPIIENTAWEHELADSLGEAIANNPKAVAILVRRHGMYVWGKTWEEAKRHGECLHYLFEVAISMKKLGMDFTSPPAPLKALALTDESGKKRGRESDVKYVLLDIEGTTTPISFVKDVLFPYSVKHFESYLEASWDEKETQEDLSVLSKDSAVDVSKKASLPNVVAYLANCVVQDKKCSYLKNIQGRIWDKGYSSGDLKSGIYDDVLKFFVRSKEENFKIAIYSSGSRNAQKLLFKYSNLGDLRGFISCYFDTSVGQKQEAASYCEIVKTLGVDSADEIVFVTDIPAEGAAAKLAGMRSVLAVRPGNAPLPADHNFTTVSTFDNLLK
jgi:methylthioribulose 1-phosphate dehydratase / enolase-phosphatase E1